MKTHQQVPARSAEACCIARAREVLRSQSGQSLYEMALLAPLLLTVLLGVIELGRYAYISILVANAARAGAAYGAQSLPQGDYATSIIAAAGNDFKNNGQGVSLLTVQGGFLGADGQDYNACTCEDNSGVMNPDPTTNGAGAVSFCDTSSNPYPGVWCPTGQHWVVLVSVEAKGTFNSLFSFIPGLNSIAMDSKCTLRVNQQ